MEGQKTLLRRHSIGEKFDFCVSRAVANLATLSEYCLPYVKIGGYFVPYKSEDIDKEVEQAENSVQILGGTVEEVKKFKLPGTEIGRALIKIKKIRLRQKSIRERLVFLQKNHYKKSGNVSCETFPLFKIKNENANLLK